MYVTRPVLAKHIGSQNGGKVCMSQGPCSQKMVKHVARHAPMGVKHVTRHLFAEHGR